MRAGCAACVAVAGWLLIASARADEAAVTIIDELGAGQEEESVAVYANDRLIGTLHVDATHPIDQIEAVVPEGALDYTLCGQLRRREPDGRQTVRSIDNAGRVHVHAGDTLRAYVLSDALFALNAPGQEFDVTRGPACAPTVS